MKADHFYKRGIRNSATIIIIPRDRQDKYPVGLQAAAGMDYVPTAN
jgi:hypothetical protein